MDFGEVINWLPLWLVFVLTVVVSLLSVAAGTRLAQNAIRKQNEKDPDGPLGSLVAAVLGLVAFILSFTFGMTSSRFDTRRQLVLDECNAVGTTYLRAGLLPKKQGAETRRLLLEYVEVRLKHSGKNIPVVLTKSDDLHIRLWSEAESLMKEDMDSEIRSLYIDSLNTVIDLHQSRKTVAVLYRIPGGIWASVFILSSISMLALGFQVGMSGARRLRGTPVLALAFSLVIVMIADVDRPGEGVFQVSQQPLEDVRQMMLATQNRVGRE